MLIRKLLETQHSEHMAANDEVNKQALPTPASPEKPTVKTNDPPKEASSS